VYEGDVPGPGRRLLEVNLDRRIFLQDIERI
jgi:hypothetical protein